MSDLIKNTTQEIPKAYDPKTVEDKWYAYWMKHRLFHAEVNKNKKPFTIVIPPPNVTGALHIGHAYNNSVQDIYVRFKRMQGFETLWSPGTDHAGIATQTVVEKQLKSEGKDRRQMGRDAFVEEVWKHKEIYRARIIGQLQKMGCSCDWDREWFTMDETLSDAVLEVFIHFYEKGWIYKGNYIVNWCPFSQSAISDEEVEYKEVNGKLWHFKYPVKDSDEFMIVATTRPETMLGDTGVAVHPDDERYKHLNGKKVILPIVGREIPIFADAYVDKEFGTGAVKVTPSHDPNDFQMGKRHQLEFVNIMHADASLNKNVPEKYQGLDRFTARKKVVEEMQQLGFLEKIEDHLNRVGYSQRGNVPIEPLVSEQWFLKMEELAKPALQAVQNGKIKIHPEKWIKTYEHWMTTIRDWCISRQLWWGHRIPAYYLPSGEMVVAKSREDAAEKFRIRNLKFKTEDIRQDDDVLDTWF
ncbi:valine--tRNA ligase, partial [bacterium]|nr:valine--tRNA ligase [bacterium]